MACYKPLTGYRGRKVLPSGRRPVVFKKEDGFADLPVQLPCGQCIGCRLERSRQWAVRCMHEASLYDVNCSVTLTYSDEFLPMKGGLVPNDSRNFIRRLRRRVAPASFTYFLCGEYGGQFERAHYHALLFGVWFGDSRPWKLARSGCQLYRSATLDELWPFGHADIGELTFDSAAYAARYVIEKINGDEAPAHYDGKLPEFVRMSPGIGRRWFERFKDDVYPSDEVVVGGRVGRPPLFYDRLLGRSESEVLEAIKTKRTAKAVKRGMRDRTPTRLEVREGVTRARLNLYKT